MCHEVFEVINSHACVCALNNLLLLVIVTTILIVIFKKVTHNSLIFYLLNTLTYINIPIKLTYICMLLNKNLLHNIGYLVNYLTKHKKIITSSMFKYTYYKLPY
jgi:hypothetical protein